MKSVIQTATRIIIKVGSSLVTNDGRGLDHAAIARWASQIAALRALGKEVVLVSSGAIAEGKAGDPALEAMAGGAGSSIGRGGMLTKILAARRAAGSGAHTIIAWGRDSDVLTRLANGEAIGTQLTAQTGHLTARKQWMSDHLHTAGKVVLDAGAVAKLSKEGKSLLPIGVIDVKGEFGRGAVITCLAEDGTAVARGISNYTSSETRRIMRKPSAEIEKILGFLEGPELIHRDNLVLI